MVFPLDVWFASIALIIDLAEIVNKCSAQILTAVFQINGLPQDSLHTKFLAAMSGEVP